MLFKLFSKKAKVKHIGVNLDIYDMVTRELRESKYCEISEEEKQFIHHLILRLSQNGETKNLTLRRMSNKAIDVNYITYPIGKVKLQGRKTWMQILIDLYEYETLEGTLQDYLDGIDRWVLYIKKHLNAT